jgi:hypothetical protein
MMVLMDYLFVIFPKFLIIVDPIIPLLEKKKKKNRKDKERNDNFTFLSPTIIHIAYPS